MNGRSFNTLLSIGGVVLVGLIGLILMLGSSGPSVAAGSPLPADTPELERRWKELQAQYQILKAEAGGKQVYLVPYDYPKGLVMNTHPYVNEYNFVCVIDPYRYDEPHACGTTDIWGQFRPVATDRDLGQVIRYLTNANIVEASNRWNCTQYVCLGRDGSVIGAVQPHMAQWMRNNCTIFTTGEYSC